MIEHRIIINRIRLIERDDRGIKKRGEKVVASSPFCWPFAVLLEIYRKGWRGARRESKYRDKVARERYKIYIRKNCGYIHGKVSRRSNRVAWWRFAHCWLRGILRGLSPTGVLATGLPPLTRRLSFLLHFPFNENLRSFIEPLFIRPFRFFEFPFTRIYSFRSTPFVSPPSNPLTYPLSVLQKRKTR